MTQPKLSPATAPANTPANTPLDPKRFPATAQTEPTAGRDDVRQTAPPMHAPRQSQRPPERSGKGRSSSR